MSGGLKPGRAFSAFGASLCQSASSFCFHQLTDTGFQLVFALKDK